MSHKDNNDEMNENSQKSGETEVTPPLDREELEWGYLNALEYEPYPFQEKAIQSWFQSSHGVLVCAPTGMGKTLIAEAALYEALKTGKKAYYTTPLIALTEQKYAELQNRVERWGFKRSQVGLITGNRRENADAPILVVVAEILFNRLISSDSFAEFAESKDPAPPPAPVAETPQEDGKPRITAASLNAKKSVAVDWRDEEKAKKPQVEEAKKTAAIPLPEIPVNPDDFEEDVDFDPEDAFFSFEDVSAVVMDEFHQFSDPERGVVWEFTLALLPLHVRTLLISATVGNAVDFQQWLERTSGRKLDLVTSTTRKVPLLYRWIDDKYLTEELREMRKGEHEGTSLTPALVFCFNRDECWELAAKARTDVRLEDKERRKLVEEELKEFDLKQGAGPRLRELFMQGIGVHHAGLLPKYKRVVETLFQKKLLSFCMCTETLAAGVNLPARSVVLPTLLKGPANKKTLVEPSVAQQIFGRAGRPQFDTEGYVFAICPEEEVKIERARRDLDKAIPPGTKDPRLLAERRKREKKLPKRNSLKPQWTEKQFIELQNASPSKLGSRGPLPWRLLGHMLAHNPDVEPIRKLVARRLTGPKRLAEMQVSLDKALMTLWRGGFVRLAPNPTNYGIPATPEAQKALMDRRRDLKEKERRRRPFGAGIFDDSSLNEFDDSAFDFDAYEKELKKCEERLPETPVGLPEGFDFFSDDGDLFTLDQEPESAAPDAPQEAPVEDESPAIPVLTFGGRASSSAPSPVKTKGKGKSKNAAPSKKAPKPASKPASGTMPSVIDLTKFTPEIRDQIASSYRASYAYPTPKLKTLTSLRTAHPVYGAFLLEYLGGADKEERLQAFESILETPQTVARYLRVPRLDVLPAGKLATERLDQELLQKGLATIAELVAPTPEDEERAREERRRFGGDQEERVYQIPFAEKLRRLFDYHFPGVDLRVAPVWAAGDILLRYGGDFNKYISSKRLQTQEGVVFRHLLRLIQLVEEFIPLDPVDYDARLWRAELREIVDALETTCRAVDPLSVDETLRASKKTDLLDQK